MARILLVDDEESVLQSVGLLLGPEGHDVTSISNSEEAVDIIRSEEYDIMITDIRMAPVDGIQLINIAREIRPSMPLIVISAYTSDAVVKQCTDLGCIAYIKKPFSINDVINAVNQALTE